jgi:D-3-phosphoglycerate dehydrogenase/C-terminal binding protein
MPLPRVIITDFVCDDLTHEREVLGDIATITALNAFHEDELLGKVEDAAAIMVYHNLSVSKNVIHRLTQCKLIVRCGVGIDNVDGAAARAKGIPFCNVPDYGTEDVADTALALLLSLTRGTQLQNSMLRAKQGEWKYTLVKPLHRLREATLGIVGLGQIGTAFALRAKALGMDVAFFDPYLGDGADKAIGIRRIETLDELLATSLVVSLHCPLTSETRHLIGPAELAKMRRGAYLINSSRGAVVDTAALPAAISSGQLAGAGIDVLEKEPPPDDHPLVAAWRDPKHPCHHRVIINPHSAFYTEEGMLEMRRKGSLACRRALLGERLRNVVN